MTHAAFYKRVARGIRRNDRSCSFAVDDSTLGQSECADDGSATGHHSGDASVLGSQLRNSQIETSTTNSSNTEMPEDAAEEMRAHHTAPASVTAPKQQKRGLEGILENIHDSMCDEVKDFHKQIQSVRRILETAQTGDAQGAIQRALKCLEQDNFSCKRTQRLIHDEIMALSGEHGQEQQSTIMCAVLKYTQHENVILRDNYYKMQAQLDTAISAMEESLRGVQRELHLAMMEQDDVQHTVGTVAQRIKDSLLQDVPNDIERFWQGKLENAIRESDEQREEGGKAHSELAHRVSKLALAQEHTGRDLERLLARYQGTLREIGRKVVENEKTLEHVSAHVRQIGRQCSLDA